MERPPAVDPRDPVSMATWATWISDRIVWMLGEIAHLHECIERRSSQAEELSESRHQENLQALGKMASDLLISKAFIENATTDEKVKAAVTAERKRVADKAASYRTRIQSTCYKLAEWA